MKRLDIGFPNWTFESLREALEDLDPEAYLDKEERIEASGFIIENVRGDD